jgi:hypothetical protein
LLFPLMQPFSNLLLISSFPPGTTKLTLYGFLRFFLLSF